MKIKLAVSDDSFEEIRQFLLEKGIEIDDDADYILTQKEKFIGHLAVRDKAGDKLHISVEDIVFIESFGHNLEIHTVNEVYTSSERLYYILSLLDPRKFIRISNSVIVARNKVKRINPAFSMKFVLDMADGTRVDVTRSYYNSFRDEFNI